MITKYVEMRLVKCHTELVLTSFKYKDSQTSSERRSITKYLFFSNNLIHPLFQPLK